MVCPACNKNIEEGSNICPHCGEFTQKRERGNLLLPPNPIKRPLSTFEYLVMFVLIVISPVNIILFLIFDIKMYKYLNIVLLFHSYLFLLQ